MVPGIVLHVSRSLEKGGSKLDELLDAQTALTYRNIEPYALNIEHVLRYILSRHNLEFRRSLPAREAAYQRQ